MKTPLVLLFVLGLANTISATVYTRCALAKALTANGIPKAELSNWVCLVESESSRNTAAKGGPNSNGSYDYGLFQINDGYWCGVNAAGKDCKVKCSALLDNTIKDDVTCALLIHKRHGFTAWYGWINKCQNKPLPDLSSC